MPLTRYVMGNCKKCLLTVVREGSLSENMRVKWGQIDRYLLEQYEDVAQSQTHDRRLDSRVISTLNFCTLMMCIRGHKFQSRQFLYYVTLRCFVPELSAFSRSEDETNWRHDF